MQTTATSVLLTLLAGVPSSLPQERNAEREAFLREAEAVERETIDTGITRPERVKLRRGDEMRRAVFKSFETDLPGWSGTIGLERQHGLRDSWKFEVAAYELDQLLGLGMVPVTVEREIDGLRGAIIDWVDDVLPEFETSPDGFSIAAWQERIETVWLFDYLAYNIDRTPENLLVTAGFDVRLIDHSRAFQKFLTPMRPLSRFPKPVIDRLRALDDAAIERALGPYLGKEEMEALLERKRRVLAQVDDLLRKRQPDEVFFVLQ